MVLTLHIIIALIGLIIATTLIISPTKQRVLISKIAAASTLLSGIYLVYELKSSLIKVCLTGILYFSFVLIITAQASRKLNSAAETAR